MVERPYKWSSSPPPVYPCWKIGFLSTPALVPSAGKVATTAAGSIAEIGCFRTYVLFLLAWCSVTSTTTPPTSKERNRAKVGLVCCAPNVCGWVGVERGRGCTGARLRAFSPGEPVTQEGSLEIAVQPCRGY